jgi:hypothetical protein
LDEEENLTEDELEEMIVLQAGKRDRKHRGYGGYERNRIYRGARAEKED